MVAIIDYGMGNIHSVQKALESIGARTRITNNPRDLSKSASAVLPGVGAFGDAILELKKQGLIEALITHIRQKKVFLGICLGMHILFETSEESPKVRGLGVIKGRVKKFAAKLEIKVPHIGWNQLRVRGYGVGETKQQCPLLKGIPDNAYVYFCHSYYPQPKNKDVIAATTDYGKEFASVVWQGNVFGVQFHPEKSQEIGLKMLRNFVELC